MPLFPEITPFKTGRLPLTDGHVMYYELSGNPKGTPILFLHGGPGNGISSKHKRYVSPKTHLIITYDQRGCGKSKPFAELRANTTSHLVADIERLRAHLGLKRWVVGGASWGVTLALAYAQAHPKTVRGLMLSGVFLGTRRECEWITHPGGVARFHPQEYAMMLEALGNPRPDKVNQALVAKLKGPSKKERAAAALAWCRLESVACNPTPNRVEIEKELLADSTTLISLCLLEAHYFQHDCFLKPDQLLKGVSKIAHIPMAIVHGELDMVCPPESAYALHAAHPRSTLTMVEGVGHGGPQMQNARKKAFTAFMTSLKPE
jgi:proline iminopeptidase